MLPDFASKQTFAQFLDKNYIFFVKEPDLGPSFLLAWCFPGVLWVLNNCYSKVDPTKQYYK